MFSFFKNRNLLNNASDSLFIKLNQYARNGEFFGDNLIEDSPDGRFEAVALFATAIFIGLANRGEYEKQIAQTLFDKIFKTFDQALRELGVSDVKVGTRVKKMSESYFGRQNSYAKAYENSDKSVLERKIALNVFGRDVKEDKIFCETDIEQKLANSFRQLVEEIKNTEF